MNLRQQAARLRALGFGVRYGKRGVKSTPQAKAAVARIAKRVDRLERENVFVPGTRADVRRYGVAGKRTRKGIFVPVPYGVAQRDFDARFSDGVLRVRYRDKEETVYPLDPVAMAKDPAGAVERIIRSRKTRGGVVMVTVNGFDGRRTFDLALGARYFVELQANFRPGPKGHKFTDVFRLKIVRHVR